MLPSGPKWSVKRFNFEGEYITDEPVILYKRDAAECVEYLLNNPLFADSIEFVPKVHYDSEGTRIFGSPLSAYQAWETQVRKFILLAFSIYLFMLT